MTRDEQPELTNLSPIWQAELDGYYDVRVLRIAGLYQGILKVTDTRDGSVLLEETVAVSYGAVFGPDMADVADWQDRAVQAVDTRSAR